MSGDTLSQVREHYEVTLAAASEQHSAEVLRLQQEVDRLRGEERGKAGQPLEEEEEEERGPSIPPSFLGEAVGSEGHTPDGTW